MVDTINLKDGKLTVSGVPFTFVLMKSAYYQYKELEKVLGKDWKKLVYERGKRESEESIKAYLSIFHNDPNVQKLIRLFGGPLTRFLVHQYNTLGVGRLELITEDSSKPLLVFRLQFCPIALVYLEHEKAKEQVCYEAAGSMAGGLGFIYPGIEIAETKCLAKGDPYCEFVASIPKR